ncbi:hypothetical protein FJZ28_00610 [Candidatus Peregrinibacteria bacterium]|nr:hypothetical protein [Candidatus Peregrinibacteria bacterium]
MRKKERMEIFVRTLWEWFCSHKRDLPWRDLDGEQVNRRAYCILVSEVMLQQTQVSRVKIVFKNFLEVFPQITDLALASNRDVLLAWRSMGYNSRALRLRDAARTITEKFPGSFPMQMEELQAISGIGHYTAAAIRNFAFHLPTPCLDTNIRRILHRSFVGPENADGTYRKDDAYILKIAAEVLEEALATHDRFLGLSVPLNPKSLKTNAPRTFPSADWHAALMDYGSLVCTKRNPKWDVCPLTKAGIMKAAYCVPTVNSQQPTAKPEPGRIIGSKFIPNRIIRGRIVEELRDEPSGLPLPEIGSRVCIDWSPRRHTVWLREIIAKLERDSMVRNIRGKIALAD